MQNENVIHWIRTSGLLVSQQPSSCAAIAAGDWNFEVCEKPAVVLNDAFGSVQKWHSVSNHKSFSKALEAFVAMRSDYLTHYNKECETSATIDRTYIACPT